MAITTRPDISTIEHEAYTNEIFASASENSVIMRLGTRLPNMASSITNMPIMSALPTAYFVDGETGGKKTTSAAWQNKQFNVGHIAVILPIAQAVIDDASVDIWSNIKPHLGAAVGKVFDAAALYGTNKPAVWPVGIVPDAVVKGKTVSLAEKENDLFVSVLGEGGLYSLLEDSGFDATSSIAHHTVKAKIRNTRTTVGEPLFMQALQGQYSLDGTPILFPKTGVIDPAQSLMVAGDWSQLVWAVRQDITYKILDQATIYDFSGETPTLMYALAQQGMVALMVTFRCAWQLPNPVNQLDGTANRYPFAVLTA